MRNQLSIRMLLAIALFGGVSLFSCAKDDTSNKAAVLFTWTEGTTSYTADSDTAYSFSDAIVARKNTGSDVRHVEVFFGGSSNFAAADYTVGVGSIGISIWNESVGPGTPTYTLTGTIHITDKVNNRISGNFNGNLNNGLALSGSFTNVPID